MVRNLNDIRINDFAEQRHQNTYAGIPRRIAQHQDALPAKIDAGNKAGVVIIVHQHRIQIFICGIQDFYDRIAQAELLTHVRVDDFCIAAEFIQKRLKICFQ